MNSASVLTNCAAVTSKDCRAAVARIIRDLQLRHELTDCDFAESIGCSVGTVRNARNEESDLGAIWLTRIERRFGAGSINPYLALGGSRGVPLDVSNERDVLPFIARANLAVASARDPQSPGGTREVHTEKLGYLPDLKALQKELSALICSIEAEAA